MYEFIERHKGYLFTLLAAVFVLSTLFKPYPLSWLVKLLPLLLLIIISFKKSETKLTKYFLAGLIFSVLGDFFLDYDRINWFIFGLGAFLVAHLFYIKSLMPVEKKRVAIVTFYTLYGIAVFVLISSGLGELFIPVLIYMSVLLGMAIATLVSKNTNSWLILGGLSFVLSDSLLGIDKFYSPIPYATLFIMISYYFAQYALVRGYYRR
ncbi:MAG: lysoplasmalogenase [Colwellia sp.]|nr:lysoplasmalogenase [Colwellia sp.]